MRGRRMKKFEFAWEDGPVAYNCHTTVIEALNYSQALRKLKEDIQTQGRWDWVGYHNIRYLGMIK